MKLDINVNLLQQHSFLPVLRFLKITFFVMLLLYIYDGKLPFCVICVVGNMK